MRGALIDYYIEEIATLFGNPHDSVAYEKMQSLYDEKNYAKLVGIIKATVQLDAKLRIGWQRNIKETGFSIQPIEFESNRPGLAEATRFTLYFHRSITEAVPFEMFARGVTHILTRAVLARKNSELHNDPGAVDVAAMHLGLSQLYLQEKSYFLTRADVRGIEVITPEMPGTITLEEARYVAAKLHKGSE